jgi:peroxiredoxin
MISTNPRDYAGPGPGQALQAGARAPNFCLRTTPDQAVSLDELRAQHPLILAFYPADWSPVCGDELTLFNECLPEFQKHDAELAGISVDGVWCHIAFSKARKLKFPLLSDFEPKGATAQSYGAYRRMDGVCERALFLVDMDGVIRWSHVSPIGVSPGVDGILNALEALPKHKQEEVKA